MLTRSVLVKFAIVLMPLAAVAGCTKTTPAATETEAARCTAWRDSLPSRSKSDTPQTQAEIGTSYDVFLAACPGYGLPF